MIFNVRISETQYMDVEIEANTSYEAEQIAERNHRNGEYDVDESENRLTEYEADRVSEDSVLLCPKCGCKMDEHDFDDEDGNFDGWGWVCPNCAHTERDE